MPPIEQKIVVNINAIVNGLADVKALGVGVVNVGKSAGVVSNGFSQFDASLSRSQRASARLTVELKQLQRELDALNKKIARDGQFAVPTDITRAQQLTEQVAQRERSLNEENHLKAVANIRERREAILATIEAEKKASAKAEQEDAASSQRTLSDKAQLREAQAAQQRKFTEDAAKLEQKAASEFDNRIAAKIEKRKKDQAVALASIENEARGFSRLSKLAEVAVSPIKRIGSAIVGIFSQVARQIEFAIAAFILFAASSPALIFGALIKEGIEFNSVMEQARIGLSALLQSTQLIFSAGSPNKPLEGIEAFTAATKIAEEVTQSLQIKLIPLKATSEELIPIFNQIVTAAAGAGLTIQQTEDTFISLAGAAQILQVPIDRLGTEIRLLLSGATRETSRLGPALFGSAKAAREFVKEHRAIGDLFPALQTKLAAYNTALLVSTSSFSVLAQNAKEVFQRLSALATSGLFDKIKEGLVKITQSFFDLDAGKIKPEFAGLFEFINRELTKLGAYLVDLVDKAVAYLTRIAKYVQENQRYVEDILFTLGQILKQLVLIGFELVGIVGDTNRAKDKTADWKTTLEYVAAVLATIRDEMKIVIGAFQALAGVIAVAILLPLEGVADLLGLISQRAASAAVNLHNARVAAENFAEAGKDRFVEGITFSSTREEINAQNARDIANQEPDATGATFRPFIKNRDQKDQNNGLTFRPNPNVKLDASGGAGQHGGGDKVLNRLFELRKQTADILRDLYNTRLSIERTGEERSFDLTRSSSTRQLDTLNDNLKHRLVSTLDYYKDKQRLETAAIDAERKHLVDQFKFEERETVSAIQAIEQEFDAKSAEPKNKDARIQAELSKQKQLKVDGEMNKLEEKRVKMNGEILELDNKQTESTRQNNLGLEDGLDTLRRTNEQIQEQLLDSQGRTTDAEIRRIAEQYRDELLTVLTETNPATEALSGVIENIKVLGNVTSSALLGLLDDAGVKFDDLSEDTKALIKLMRQLEASAVFQGLQTKAQDLTGALDTKRSDIQDKVTQGVLSEAKGRHQVALAEREVQAELDKVIEKMAALPGLTDAQVVALQQLKLQTSQMGREIDELGTTINEGIKSEFSTFGDSIVDDFAHLRQNARKFLLDVVADIGKAIIQTVVLKNLFDALGLNKQGTTGPGSAGGVGGFLSGLFGHVQGHYEGGLVDGPLGGRDALLRRLTRGEWVVPASSVQRVGTGVLQSITDGSFGRLSRTSVEGNGRLAASRQLPPKVVFAMSEEEIANASMSRAGEKVFLYHMQKHAKAFQG